MIEIINKSILEINTKYIAHQTNCTSKYAKGLAKSIFDVFPYANSYAGRTFSDLPGNIQIFGSNNDRLIINMMGQIFPGKPTFSGPDSLKNRQIYFHKCLIKIAKIKDLDSISFPFGIGCGLAGGEWDYYYNTIVNFKKFVEKNQVKVVFCKI